MWPGWPGHVARTARTCRPDGPTPDMWTGRPGHVARTPGHVARTRTCGTCTCGPDMWPGQPGLQQWLPLWRQWRPHLRELRAAVAETVQLRVEEAEPETRSWFQSLAPHVKKAYTAADGRISLQLPVLQELASEFGWPPDMWPGQPGHVARTAWKFGVAVRAVRAVRVGCCVAGAAVPLFGSRGWGGLDG